MVQWVEKASLEKIRKLLEISEQELHYKVLLTLKNLADVRRSLAPYNLPIIPRSLPLEIMNGEYFVTSNLLSLIVGNESPSGHPEAETLNREQRHGPRLYHWPLPGRIPALLHMDPVEAQGVSFRRGSLYQERGSVL